MPKFTINKSLVEVKVHYLELDGGELFFLSEKEDIEQNKDKIKVAKAYFERPSWKTWNQFMKGSIETNQVTGTQHLDMLSLRDKKLRTLLKKLVDGDSNEILLNKDFFDNCNPDFALAMVDAYDETISEERTNSYVNDETVKKIMDKRVKDLAEKIENTEPAKEPEKEASE